MPGQGKPGRDGQQRRRARPSIESDRAGDRSHHVSFSKFPVFDFFGFRFVIFRES